MEVRYTRKAVEDFKSLPHDTQRRIAKKMRFYASQSKPLKFAKRLIDPREGEFRFRIGDYRIFFDVKKDTLFILKIKHRKDAYE